MDLKRHEGILVVAAGVAAAFVVIIGTGYRVTNSPGSPIGDYTYYVSIGVLVGVTVEGAKRFWPRTGPGSPTRGRAATQRDRERLAEERRQGEDERRRRLETLAADPARRTYAERIQRGEAWSDVQIAYDLNVDRLATCEHLAPIEREMRSAGIKVRLLLGSKISARCRIDVASLHARFTLPPFVAYAEPQPQGRALEDPLPAMIACAEHSSAIDVVHPVDATPETPVFPGGDGPV